MGVLWKKNYPPVRGFYLKPKPSSKLDPTYRAEPRLDLSRLRPVPEAPCTSIACTVYLGPEGNPM